MKQGHCTRCGSTEHLPSKCAQEAKGWEVDFNKGAEFWTRTAGKLAVNGKQARMQIWAWHQSAVLCVRIEDELVILDSASDVSLARVDALIDVHDSYARVPIAHIEGQTILDKDLPDGDSLLVHAVTVEQLPKGVVALFGINAIRELGISLDFVLANSGCTLQESRLLKGMSLARVSTSREMLTSEWKGANGWCVEHTRSKLPRSQ